MHSYKSVMQSQESKSFDLPWTKQISKLPLTDMYSWPNKYDKINFAIIIRLSYQVQSTSRYLINARA